MKTLTLLFIFLLVVCIPLQAQEMSSEIELPMTVEEARVFRDRIITQISDEREVSDIEAIEIYREALYSDIQDGSIEPTVFSYAQIPALEEINVSLEGLDECGYIVLPENVTFQDYSLNPDQYLLPECLPY